MSKPWVHLGDNIYAELLDGILCLAAEEHLGHQRVLKERIYLDPSVLAALLKYLGVGEKEELSNLKRERERIGDKAASFFAENMAVEMTPSKWQDFLKQALNND